MQKITISDFRKYTEIINEATQDLGRYPLPEEFAVCAGLQTEDKISFAREIYYFIRDDIALPEKDPEKYELIIRRGLGNNELKKLRIKNNLTQTELADKLGYSKALISQWENCRTYPPFHQRVKVAELFGCDEKYLFPEWLSFLADELNNRKMEQVVEVGKLSLNSPDVLMLEAENVISPERILDKVSGENILKIAEKICTPREIKIIKLRFGFTDDREPVDLEDVAHEYGVTRCRILQVQSRALDKIRNHFQKNNSRYGGK